MCRTTAKKIVVAYTPERRMEHRQEKTKAIVDQLFINLKKYRKDLPAKSTTAQAISYALNNKTALLRFLNDGKIEIDNNAAERAMRPIAVGRLCDASHNLPYVAKPVMLC